MAPHGTPPPLATPGFTGLGRFICDKLDRGLLMLDRRGRVIDGNLLGLDVLREGDALCSRAGRLAFRDRRLDARLRTFLSAGADDPSHPSSHGGIPAAHRPSLAAHLRRRERSSCRVVVSAVPRQVIDRSVAYVVLIYAPDQHREISASVLAELYGLTRAQADVARSLYSGRSVDETARALGLSANTVRSHMKQIFTRCEVQSQAELMQLLALGPHAL